MFSNNQSAFLCLTADFNCAQPVDALTVMLGGLKRIIVEVDSSEI